MVFSIPRDACRAPLTGAALTIRVSTYAATAGAPVSNHLVPAGRPSDYLFCPSCASMLDAYIRHVEVNRGAPSEAAEVAAGEG